LAITGGELYLQHPQSFVMDVALDKTIQEFKMWGAMTRKPGQPTDYLRQIYTELITQQQVVVGGEEKYPEVVVERVWEAFIKRLLQKDYQFDAGFYGSLNEFSRKVAYFFHASLQGLTAFPGATAVLKQLAARGIHQGLLGNGQSFTAAQLQRALVRQDPECNLDAVVDPDLRALSYQVRGRQPSERLFRHALGAFAERGITPDSILHVGSRISLDVVPARRLGLKTGLFAGDRASLQATSEQLKDPTSRPDVLLTELAQITEIVCSP
jgi:FMN phosphatase YigB (HAD superfamily)